MGPPVDRKGKGPLVEPTIQEILEARRRAPGGVSIPGRREATNPPPCREVPSRHREPSSPVRNAPSASREPSSPPPPSSPPQPRPAGPTGIHSVLKEADVERIRAQYRIPDNICLSTPHCGDNVASSRGGGVAIYEEFLKGGLRLPLHSFVINLLDRYNLSPAQLTPNSIRIIYSFIVLCHFHGASPRVSLFRALYKLRNSSGSGWWGFASRPKRVLRLDLPSKIKGWKSRFFFTHGEKVKRSWSLPDTSPNKNPTIEEGDRDLFQALLSAVIPPCAELLSEGNLREALAAPAAPSSRAGERYCPLELIVFSFPYLSFYLSLLDALGDKLPLSL